MRINYNEIQQKAYAILKKYGKEIPIDPFDIASFYDNIFVCDYKEYSLILGVTQNDLIHKFNTDEGFLLCLSSNYEKKEYILCYNQNKTYERIRWTIAHELGHFELKHNEISNKSLLNRYSLSKKETNILEEEANHFAKHLLAPFPIILFLKKGFGSMSQKILSLIFNINFQPSGYILDNINKLGYYAEEYADEALCWKFKKSLRKILHCKHCIVCKTEFYGENSLYCPTCGSLNCWEISVNTYIIYQTFKEENMIYSKIELDGNHKAIICPTCDNEDIAEGEFCQICGSIAVNRCINIDYPSRNDYDEPCGKLLDGDARFCTHCGSESTFYNKGYLKAYCDDDLVIPDDVPF